MVAGGAGGIRQVAGEGTEEVIGNHRQLIDDDPAEVLVPGEQHIENTISACQNGLLTPLCQYWIYIVVMITDGHKRQWLSVK